MEGGVNVFIRPALTDREGSGGDKTDKENPRSRSGFSVFVRNAIHAFLATEDRHSSLVIGEPHQ